MAARIQLLSLILLVGCGPGLREEPPVPVFYPGTDHELRCDAAFKPVSELMALPRCSAATWSCVSACSDDPCEKDCLDKDATPATAYKTYTAWDADCADCYTDAIEYCGTVACRAQQTAFYCCLAGQGCTIDDDDCSPCEAQGYAYQGCMEQKSLSCIGEALKRCFP